jgi:hypothetical protein
MSMIESTGLKHQVDVMKLLYHECLRNFNDRVLMKHDKKWFVKMLDECCKKHFYCVEQLEDLKALEEELKKK